MDDQDISLFKRWVFSDYHIGAEGLGLFRIFTALFILLFMLPSFSIYSFIGMLPDAFFLPPPGPMMFFEGFPPYTFFLGVHIGLIGALCFLLVGYRSCWSAIIAGILLLVLKGFIYSIGKINHDILLATVTLVMAFSGWGAAYSIDARQGKAKFSPQSWPFVLLALIIGFLFFTAGFPKILGGWLDMGTQATQGHFFKHYFIRGRQDLLAPWALNVGPVLWEWFDYSTVIFEIGFLAAIWHVRSTRIYICIAILFHFGTMLILNIAFLPNFLAYAAFLNWSAFNEYLKKKGAYFFSNASIRKGFSPAFVAVCMLAVAGISFYLIPYTPFVSDLTIEAAIWVSIAAVIAICYLWQQVQYFAQKKFKREKSRRIQSQT